ncbi:hypothetical protein I314_02507 [Cryptococcus bacillisporus CA1873]|uniref:Uncharacterized protein n=2 Tax=Cryptococcus gattii TaxID=552467 RepID=A0A0D0VY67_CRYGA|nr:hypothetical protein I312_00246 [Cryptococcus bacillisporus CA1280]KIR67289.1 hypothetical protein I314_02507 [Cryptococcus bacillisporus CA1873]|eukprot:KIR67289.1 hypothetical protein I314_02507 [Cryptococcus gattii CA1873]
MQPLSTMRQLCRRHRSPLLISSHMCGQAQLLFFHCPSHYIESVGHLHRHILRHPFFPLMSS